MAEVDPKVARELGEISNELKNINLRLAAINAKTDAIDRKCTATQIKAAGSGGALGAIMSVFMALIINQVKNG